MSKFKSLFDAAKGREPDELEVEVHQPLVPKRRGRPQGKRSHPDYEQVTAYIRRDTHHSVKIALLKENQGREFSELVEELLAEWVKLHT